MFKIKNVSKKYKNEFALNNVSMNIGKGMNFIVGASGSGKTTLLKIISGMEQNFDGEVYYCDNDIKSLTSNEKSYFYNNIFGFVWQDFNLIEDSTVLENVMLPCYLKKNQNLKNAEKALKELKIFDIKAQKVKYLSGGQKQRVAIARELMKNPQVIIADEPTSALDEKTSKTTLDILRAISKNRTVIVVTHDTSLITEKDNVYELDKGELIMAPEINASKKHEMKMLNAKGLSFNNAFCIAKTNIKNKIGRFIISTISIMIASILLLTIVSGAISNSSQEQFDKLIKTYGDSLTDIGIYNSFTDAAGTDGNDKKKPSGDVSQDISGLYDKYAKDERVAFMSYMQAFDNIKIKVDGKEHSITSSGNAPAINKLITGKMPMGDENEVVVPESFAKLLGVSPELAIGKEIDFSATVVDWSTGKPVWKKTNSKAKIVGVMDTTATYDYEGQTNKYTIDDAFLFSKPALDIMLKQVGKDINKTNFSIRAKTAAGMISLKDELNEKGIVPLGRFELVEDMVRLNNQTKEQSGSTSIIIGILSLIMIIAIFLINSLMRKREYAIYKVSGYNRMNLSVLTLLETLCLTISAILLMFVTSPLLNIAIKNMFGFSLLNLKILFFGVLLILLTSAVAYLVSVAICIKTNAVIALKSGDR